MPNDMKIVRYFGANFKREHEKVYNDCDIQFGNNLRMFPEQKEEIDCIKETVSFEL